MPQNLVHGRQKCETRTAKDLRLTLNTKSQRSNHEIHSSIGVRCDCAHCHLLLPLGGRGFRDVRECDEVDAVMTIEWHGLENAVCYTKPENWPWEETVGEKKIKVPEGMLKAGRDVVFSGIVYQGYVHDVLEAALRWLSENPIVPTEQQALAMKVSKERFEFDPWEWVRWGACEWQRHMFEDTEPEIPEEVKDLVWEAGKPGTRSQIMLEIASSKPSVAVSGARERTKAISDTGG